MIDIGLIDPDRLNGVEVLLLGSVHLDNPERDAISLSHDCPLHLEVVASSNQT